MKHYTPILLFIFTSIGLITDCLVTQKKLIDKTENGKNVPSLAVVEVVLV